jgi:hypothetical protein
MAPEKHSPSLGGVYEASSRLSRNRTNPTDAAAAKRIPHDCPSSQIRGPKPMGQGNLSPVKDCPGGPRDSMPAADTLSASTADQFVGLSVSASRTNEAVGPTTRSQILLAGFFTGEVGLKLAKRLGKCRPRHPVACNKPNARRKHTIRGIRIKFRDLKRDAAEIKERPSFGVQCNNSSHHTAAAASARLSRGERKKHLRGPVVVIQQATQFFSPRNPLPRIDSSFHRNDQPVFQALMIALLVIMVQKLVNAVPQCIFTE